MYPDWPGFLSGHRVWKAVASRMEGTERYLVTPHPVDAPSRGIDRPLPEEREERVLEVGMAVVTLVICQQEAESKVSSAPWPMAL